MKPKLLRRIEQSTENPKLITFDVFDTLITRDVDPNLVILATGRYVCFRLNLEINQANLDAVLTLRQLAWEKVISSKMIGKPGFEDGTLNEMFPVWIDELSSTFGAVSIADLTVEDLLTFELGLEKQLVRPIVDSLETLKELKNRGIKLYFVSDMYMTFEQVNHLLEKSGYKDVFSGGYVSGEHGFLKRTGNLFDLISKDGVNPDLHVGDNFDADFKMPISRFIKSLHWEAPEMLEARKRAEHLSVILRSNPELTPYALNDLVARTKGESPSSTASKIYSNFALLALNEIQKKPAHVIFPAREGLLFKAAFDSASKNKTIPKSSYAPLSRQVVIPSLYHNAPIECFRLWFENDQSLSFLNLLRKVGISDEQIRSIAKQASFPSIVERLDFYRDYLGLIRLTNVFEFQTLWKEYCLKKAKELGGILREYFDNHEVNYFVDLGWNGSIQANLTAATSESGRLKGLYMGLNPGAVRNNTQYSTYNSLVSDLGKDLFSHAAFTSPQLLEMLILAPHDTIRVVPENISEYKWVEFDEDDLGGNLKRRIHREVIEDFSSLANLKWLFDLNPNDQAAFINVCISAQLWLPGPKFVEYLGNIKTDVGFGQSNIYGLISGKKQRQGYAESLWKQGWTSVNMSPLSHMLKFGRAASFWNQLFNTQGEQFEKAKNMPQASTLQHWESTEQNSNADFDLVEKYSNWMNDSAEMTLDHLTIKKLIRLRLLLTSTNLFALISGRSRFLNNSLPTRKLIRYHKLFGYLFREKQPESTFY